MRRNSILVLMYLLVASISGCTIRKYELSAAFEPLTGLAVRGAPVTLLLVSVSIIIVITFIVIAVYILRTYKTNESFEDIFSSYSSIYLFSFIPICLLWCFGTVMHILGLIREGTVLTIDIYFTVLSALSALCTALFAVEMFQSSHSKSSYALSIVPIVFQCFWLVLIYRQNAANPVLLVYIYLCFAIVFTTLSFYYTAGFLFGKPTPGKSIVAYCCAVYFCGVALADNPGPGISLIICAILLFIILHLTMLLRNLVRRKGKIEMLQTDETVQTDEVRTDES